MIYASFILANILLAFIDSRIIQARHKILHGLNGAVYLVAVGVVVWLTLDYWLIPILLLTRAVVFGPALSLFRGLKWNYISPAPTAITDRIAKSVFGNRGTLMYGVYLLILTTIICLHYSNLL
jgi:hypothetical protein